MSSYDKKYDYQNTFNKKTYKRVTVLVPLREKTVLEKLNMVESKSAYILGLIKKDVEGKK